VICRRSLHAAMKTTSDKQATAELLAALVEARSARRRRAAGCLGPVGNGSSRRGLAGNFGLSDIVDNQGSQGALSLQARIRHGIGRNICTASARRVGRYRAFA
jgi:hypothetical protein